MNKRGRFLKKQVSLFAVFLIFVIAIQLTNVLAASMPIYVKPLSSNGSLNPDQAYSYTFNWTTDSGCNNVIFSNSSIFVVTGDDGIGFINLTIPDSLAGIPSYLCEYRNGTLRQVHTLSSQVFNQIYSQSVNATGNISASGIFYGNGSGLTNVNSSLFSGYNPSFFMPLNTSVSGNFNFNGGWTNGGLSIIGGSLYSNGTVYSVNFSNLNVSTININGSFLPYIGYDNQFNLGNGTLRWNSLFIGGNLYSNGTLYESGASLSTRYYSLTNPYSYYNSSTIPAYATWANVVNGTVAGTDWANAMNGTLATWAEVMNGTVSGGGITWAQAANGTLYPSANPFGFYNSTNPPPISNIFDQVLNTTSNVTFFNVSTQNVMANNICYTNGTNCPSSSGITWAQAYNGSLAPSGYLTNSTFLASGYLTNNTFLASAYLTNNTFLASAYLTNNTFAASGYITNNTFMTWAQANNGTIWNWVVNGTIWSQVNNGTIWSQSYNGSLAKVSAANTFGAFNQTFSTNLFFIDATDSRIGIGTISPQYTLGVIGTISGTTVFSGTYNTTIAYLYATNGSLASSGYITNNTFLASGYLTNSTFLASAYLTNNTFLASAYLTNNTFAASGYITNNTFMTWTQANNGTLATWAEVNNGTFTGSGISWATANNGTLATWAEVANGTITGGGITWAQAYNGSLVPSGYITNNTFYPYTSNPFSYYNSTTLTSDTQLDNGNGYYNSSTIPAYALALYMTNNTFYPYTGNPSNFLISETNWNGNYTNVAFENAINSFGAFNQTFDTNVLFVDATDNRIGVGTTTPQNTMNVLGDINATTSIFSQGNNLSLGYQYATNWNANYSNFTAMYANTLSFYNSTNPSVGTLLARQTLTTSGTYTPTTGTKNIMIRMVGGGGGGAGATAVTSGCDASGGGGAGAYAEKYFTGISGTYSYTIGSAGTAGTATGNGGQGGATIFTGPTTITAPGGNGSTYTVGVAGVSIRLGGGGGTIPANGDVNSGGQPGETGTCVSGTIGASGNGAASQFGSGGIGKSAAAAGVAGIGYGSGGSGGLSLSGTGQIGGAGTAGVIIVWEYR